MSSTANLFPPLKNILKNINLKRRYATELALIKGQHVNRNRHPSIIHFSVNKAATQYVKSILTRCALSNGMVPVGIHDYAFNSDFPFLDHLTATEMEKYHHIFKRHGYMYSVFGGMLEGVPCLEEYKIVFVVRDPRDILVSEYYSISLSHIAPGITGNKHNDFKTKRKKATESTIDEYVIAHSDRVYAVFYRYQELLLDKYENVYLTSFEAMLSDFGKWLNDLICYCELDVDMTTRESLARENVASKPDKEDIEQHLRKGIVGDYKHKLKPETIEYLNKKFSSVLVKYNYTKA